MVKISGKKSIYIYDEIFVRVVSCLHEDVETNCDKCRFNYYDAQAVVWSCCIMEFQNTIRTL